MNSAELDERGLIVACAGCGQNNRLPYERLTKLPRCAKCGRDLQLPDTPIDVQEKDAFDALVGRSALPVLVDFWAPWCGPCKMVAPEIAKVAKDGAGRWLVAKLNTEELPSRAQQMRVSAIPLLALFQNGREVARQAGAMPATSIRNFIAQHCDSAAR